MAQAVQITFGELAREWWERYMLKGSKEYAEESWRRLEREVMPKLGKRPVKKIDAPITRRSAK